jgi:hypothetical protein
MEELDLDHEEDSHAVEFDRVKQRRKGASNDDLVALEE